LRIFAQGRRDQLPVVVLVTAEHPAVRYMNVVLEDRTAGGQRIQEFLRCGEVSGFYKCHSCYSHQKARPVALLTYISAVSPCPTLMAARSSTIALRQRRDDPHCFQAHTHHLAD